jgi:uncharacterized membrane protein
MTRTGLNVLISRVRNAQIVILIIGTATVVLRFQFMYYLYTQMVVSKNACAQHWAQFLSLLEFMISS